MIGIENPDGTVLGIYCHWDGYPEGVGAALIQHYANEEKIRSLLAEGDMSSIGADVGEKHDFSAGRDGWCNFYARDRGEDDTEAKTYPDPKEFAHEEFAYLWRAGAWWVDDHSHGEKFERLTFKACGIADTAAELRAVTPDGCLGADGGDS